MASGRRASLWADIRFAWRTIRRTTTASWVIVLSIGAGIGVNTVVFSWMQAIVSHPMPAVADSGRFYAIDPVADDGTPLSASWLEYRDLADRLHAFRELTAFRMAPLTVGEPGHPERAYAELVSGNFFSALGLRAARGRLLRADDTAAPGREPVAVVSFDYWRSHLGGAADVPGRILRVNGTPLDVVGVAPRGFQGSILGLRFDVWLPATLAPVLFPGSDEIANRDVRAYSIIARLRPGVTAPQARAEAAATMHALAAAFPDARPVTAAEVRRITDTPRGPQRFLASAIEFLQVVMLFLLLTVCSNTANLMLAKASRRTREAGVRLALGARPWHIVRLLLVESLLLGMAGAGLGVLLALWGTGAALAVPMTAAFPVEFHTYLDLGSVAFAVGLGVFAALVFGLPPALVLAGREMFSAIRPDVRGAGGRGIRSALMGAQIALAMLVLVAAAMFWDGFVRSRETSPGFQTGGIVLAAYDLTGHPDGTDRARTAAFARRLVAGLAARPGIDAVSIAASVPLDIHGLPRTSFTIDGARREDGRDEESVSNVVTPGYFATLGIRIVQGSDFASLADPTPPPQVVVNDAFVERYLPGVLPIGHRLQSGGRAYTIVGVVATTVSDAFGEPPTPAIYFSYRDRPRTTGEVHLRTSPGADAAARAAVREVVRGIDPDLPLYNVRTMDEHIDRNLVLRKVPARMFLVLGPLLLALAAIGIHAVVDRAVAERRSEIGLRMALGAEPGRVVRGVMADSLRPVSIGAGFGWSLALLFALHLAPGGHVPWRVLLGVPAGLTAVAIAACWIPARHAASIPPAVVLRDE